MTFKECMTLKEIFPTTIFSVKLMHDCIYFFREQNEKPIKYLNIEKSVSFYKKNIWLRNKPHLILN